MDPTEQRAILRELQNLKDILKRKETQINTLKDDHQKEIDQLKQQVIKDQEELKQNILTFMLRDNEQVKKIEQLHINYDLLQNQFEQSYQDSNQKIESLLNIIDKKDAEIKNLKVQSTNNAGSRVQQIQQKQDSTYINDLQTRIYDLQNKLKQSLDKNEELQRYVSEIEYKSDRTVEIENLQKRNDQQLKAMALNYEEQLMRLRETIEQAQSDNKKLVSIIKDLERQKEKLKHELDQSNSKLEELIKACEKLSRNEQFHNELRQELKLQEERSQKLEKNYKMELASLEIQLEEATKFVSKDTENQSTITKLKRLNSELAYENEELKERMSHLKDKQSSLDTNYEDHLEQLRKANFDLTQKNFELTTIIESSRQNTIERENEIQQQFELMFREINRLQDQYELLKQKENETEYRLKLLKPKPQAKAYTEQQKRQTHPIKRPSEVRFKADPTASMVTKLDRNVYIKTN